MLLLVSVLLASLLLLCSSPLGQTYGSEAFPNNSTKRGIKGDDQRIMVDAAVYPWSALGRLNSSLGAHCTGTLVAPDLVLTAAHCLWNKRTAKWMPPQGLTFVAGYQRGEWLADSKVADYHISDSYDHAARNIANSAHDWALLRLENPIGTISGWLGVVDSGYVAGAEGRDYIVQAGYSADRPHVPTAHVDCRIEGYATEGLLMHDCDATKGDSGSPLLLWQGDDVAISAIHVLTLKHSAKNDNGVKIRGGAVASQQFAENPWLEGVPKNGVLKSGSRGNERLPTPITKPKLGAP